MCVSEASERKLSAIRSFPRFCKQFSQSSPCLPGQQGSCSTTVELSFYSTKPRPAARPCTVFDQVSGTFNHQSTHFPEGCGDCYEQGTCQGNVVTVDIASSLCDCVGLCQNTTNCEYMTYTQSNNICTMTRDCQDISTTCADCLTGPKECPPDNGKTDSMNALLACV